MTIVRMDYEPTPRQAIAHNTFADEILWGGSAGAGKSRWLRAEFIAYAMRVPGSAQVLFRRYYPDLERGGGMIPGFKMEMPEGIATYNEVKHRWTFINGSTIDLAALGQQKDVYKFQGSEYARIAFDELTQFDEFTYTYMQSRLRVSGKVKTKMTELGIRPSMLATSNPGGLGHLWVKSRFIDPAPPDRIWRPAPTLEDPKPGTRVFMPARVTDNTHVNDEYIDKLNALPEVQRRALRDGDWDVYTGQMFKEFRRDIHVIEPEDLPLNQGGVVRAVGVDWGMSAPFAAVWGALLPDGLIYIYREVSRRELTPDQQAELILDMEDEGERREDWRIPVILDSAAWTRSPYQLNKQPQVIVDGGKDVPPESSVAWGYYERFGRDLLKSIKDRVGGVNLIHDRLQVRQDGLPRLLISSQCRNLIKQLPALPRSERNPEDVDTNSDDHLFDATKYLCAYFAANFSSVITTQERIKRGRGVRAGVFGAVVSQTGGVAGHTGVGDW